MLHRNNRPIPDNNNTDTIESNAVASTVIVAQCTPQGSGAIALIRLSGAQACAVADHICKTANGQKITDAASHTVHFGYAVDLAGSTIDQVMIAIMHAPRTFTGEHVVEITCHNNQFIIEDIIARAVRAGARPARAGEFARRAFQNGKIDLIKAEAINDLIHAQTQQALKKSLAQLSGSFSQWICELEQDVLKSLMLCEAGLEFLDEEVDFSSDIKTSIAAVLKKISTVKKTFDTHEHIRRGFRVVLIGSVNAGKSSLFNALLGYKRAIVSAQAGTTRDTVEAGLTLNGNYLTVIDTAGIRQTENSIEQEGVMRSYDEAQKADIILLVFDGSRALLPEEADLYKKICAYYQNKVIPVHHKADSTEHPENFGMFLMQDAGPAFGENILKTTASDQTCIQKLEKSIDGKIRALCATLDSPFLLNKRQHALLSELENRLEHILTGMQHAFHPELTAHELRSALESITELTGKSITDAAVDAIFKEFCVGK